MIWRIKMKLVSLLEKLEYTCLQGSTDQEVKNVIYDSRKVEEGSLFICIRGAVVDGHKFVPDVVAKGAKVLIVEEAVEAPEDVTVILVNDTRYAMAFICRIFRSSGRETEDNRYYRNQRKNNHYLYGKVHSGECRI